MKKKLIIIMILFLYSCSSNKREKFSYKNTDKEFWINSYKTEVFLSCLNEGINNDSIIKILSRKDLLNMNENIFKDEIDSARFIGKNIAKNIPKPFIKIDTDEYNLLEKKFISYNCLKYYASTELDSIAKKAYEKHLKFNNGQ